VRVTERERERERERDRACKAYVETLLDLPQSAQTVFPSDGFSRSCERGETATCYSIVLSFDTLYVDLRATSQMGAHVKAVRGYGRSRSL
jgi:hypothetical protein